jgi:hypothetical protein
VNWNQLKTKEFQLNKVQTDNSNIKNKIKLRESFLNKTKKYKILDFYSGDAHIWNKIKADGYNIETTRFDQKNDKNGIYLIGNNIKYFNLINFEKYDIIDLDAYGSPYEILNKIFELKIKNKIIFCTYIQTMNGKLHNKFLIDIGIKEDWIKKIPSLFNKNPFEKMKKWLSLHGIKQIDYIEITEKKHYFAFLI